MVIIIQKNEGRRRGRGGRRTKNTQHIENEDEINDDNNKTVDTFNAATTTTSRPTTKTTADSPECLDCSVYKKNSSDGSYHKLSSAPPLPQHTVLLVQKQLPLYRKAVRSGGILWQYQTVP